MPTWIGHANDAANSLPLIRGGLGRGSLFPVPCSLASASSISPQQWLILLSFAIVAIFLLLAKWRTRPASRSRQVEQEANPRELAQVRSDLEQLLAQLDRLSTKMNQQLDQKNAELQDAVK